MYESKVFLSFIRITRLIKTNESNYQQARVSLEVFDCHFVDRNINKIDHISRFNSGLECFVRFIQISSDLYVV